MSFYDQTGQPSSIVQTFQHGNTQLPNAKSDKSTLSTGAVCGCVGVLVCVCVCACVCRISGGARGKREEEEGGGEEEDLSFSLSLSTLVTPTCGGAASQQTLDSRHLAVGESAALSLSLFFSHTHTHTHTPTQAHAHTAKTREATRRGIKKDITHRLIHV